MQCGICFLFQMRKRQAGEEGACSVALGLRGRTAAQLVPLLIKYRALDESMKCHPLGWPPCLSAFLPGLALLPLLLWIFSGKAGRAVINSSHGPLGSGRAQTKGQGTRVSQQLCRYLGDVWAHGCFLPAFCVLLRKAQWGRRRGLGWVSPRSVCSSDFLSCTCSFNSVHQKRRRGGRGFRSLI